MLETTLFKYKTQLETLKIQKETNQLSHLLHKKKGMRHLENNQPQIIYVGLYIDNVLFTFKIFTVS